jgi:hypothetical protein
MERKFDSIKETLNPFQKEFNKLYKRTVDKNWIELNTIFNEIGRVFWIPEVMFNEGVFLKYLSPEFQYAFFAWAVRYNYLKVEH